MTQEPLYYIREDHGAWVVCTRRNDEAIRWRVRFDTRQEALELADHLGYEPDDSPVGKPEHYEQVPGIAEIPTYRHTRKF